MASAGGGRLTVTLGGLCPGLLDFRYSGYKPVMAEKPEVVSTCFFCGLGLSSLSNLCGLVVCAFAPVLWLVVGSFDALGRRRFSGVGMWWCSSGYICLWQSCRGCHVVVLVGFKLGFLCLCLVPLAFVLSGLAFLALSLRCVVFRVGLVLQLGLLRRVVALGFLWAVLCWFPV